jgi:hypothetical protein
MLLDWLPLLVIMAIFFYVWRRRSRVRDARQRRWREQDSSVGSHVHSSHPNPGTHSGAHSAAMFAGGVSGGAGAGADWDDGGSDSGGGDSGGDGGSSD